MLDKARNEDGPRHSISVRKMIEQLVRMGQVTAFGVHVEDVVVEEERIVKRPFDELGVECPAMLVVSGFGKSAEQSGVEIFVMGGVGEDEPERRRFQWGRRRFGPELGDTSWAKHVWTSCWPSPLCKTD